MSAAAAICGGTANTASGSNSFVGGGEFNSATGNDSAICGGNRNTASGNESFIGGGNQNIVTGADSVIAGGLTNNNSGFAAFVGGGITNNVSGFASGIASGQSNLCSGNQSFIGGGVSNRTTLNFVPVVCGGILNTASNNAATVCGGAGNTASGINSFVGGGEFNIVTGDQSTISGGTTNTALNFASTIGGGNHNTASGFVPTISGGINNTATGDFSTIPGGGGNTATGFNSMASGFNSRAVHNNTFAWGSSNGPTTTSTANQVIFNVTGAAYTPQGAVFINPSPPLNNTFFINGDLLVTGRITALTGIKAFLIDHPVLENKMLNHICIESPRADLHYRGKVQLVNGRADVDIDEASNMTSTTFSKLTHNAQVFLTSRSRDPVEIEDYDTLPSGKFTIISSDNQSTTVVDWLVIAERINVNMIIETDKV